ncbi:MAG: 8-amino-7-oxononanoate synthase [Rhodospirillaceae bacterium TMED8]|nr:8-amino-7-oxononanoate synthase [Magnetovibrio sp.]OUT50774.1 MAG: 8-amino-7-oxononanoate synthase [Rhodospirillaceae bacterium TMED8]|tara:strand:+ start:1024 stop:2205 length:1182 start_codon:yes stop_codon:yes gene_type:complete
MDIIYATTSLNTFAQRKLSELEKKNLRRHVTVTKPLNAVEVIRDNKRLINFSSNDYLGFNHHPALKKAAIEATERYGVGSGASRLVTGTHPLFNELEGRLAKIKGTDDAVVFGSGFLTNSGLIPALMGPEDLILVDELAHACIYLGARLTGGTQQIFRHNDLSHLRELLKTHRRKYRHTIIVTDGVFSMDGDLAPIAKIADIADSFDSWLMTDDAHGIGVIGEGRGSSFQNGRHLNVPLQMGTLSKAIGGYGGYLCSSKPVIDLIRTRCRTFIYSTGLPPASVATAIAALDLIESNPLLAARPLELAKRFTRRLNLPVAQSPIVPLILGDTNKTLRAGNLLEEMGFLVIPIRPPTVPEGTARLRITFSAAHQETQVDKLAEIIRGRLLEDSAQ